MLYSSEQHRFFTSTLRLSPPLRKNLSRTSVLIHMARVMSIAAMSIMLQFGSLQSALAGTESGTPSDVAEPASPDAATAADPIVLLGVFIDGKSEKGLRDVVTDRLSRLGEEVTLVQEYELLACKQTACYAEISTRKNASRVLRIDVYESSARRYFVEGAIYERAKGSSRSSSAGCDDCSSDNLRGLLGDLAARLVTAPDKPAVRVSPQLPAKSSAPPQTTLTIETPPAPPPPRLRSRWTPGRIALVTLLSTVTGAALIGTIVTGTTSVGVGTDAQICTLDQQEKPQMAPPCISRTALTITGGVLTALSGAGLALSLNQFLGKETAF